MSTSAPTITAPLPTVAAPSVRRHRNQIIALLAAVLVGGYIGGVVAGTSTSGSHGAAAKTPPAQLRFFPPQR